MKRKVEIELLCGYFCNKLRPKQLVEIDPYLLMHVPLLFLSDCETASPPHIRSKPSKLNSDLFCPFVSLPSFFQKLRYGLILK